LKGGKGWVLQWERPHWKGRKEVFGRKNRLTRDTETGLRALGEGKWTPHVEAKTYSGQRMVRGAPEKTTIRNSGTQKPPNPHPEGSKKGREEDVTNMSSKKEGPKACPERGKGKKKGRWGLSFEKGGKRELQIPNIMQSTRQTGLIPMVT